jgi:hypothetical protein
LDVNDNNVIISTSNVIANEGIPGPHLKGLVRLTLRFLAVFVINAGFLAIYQNIKNPLTGLFHNKYRLNQSFNLACRNSSL